MYRLRTSWTDEERVGIQAAAARLRGAGYDVHVASGYAGRSSPDGPPLDPLTDEVIRDATTLAASVWR